MLGSSWEAGSFPHLPDEISLRILQYLPDLPTLFEITSIIYPSCLHTPSWALLSRFVDRYPLQLRKLIRCVLCVRYGEFSNERGLGYYLATNLENLQPPQVLPLNSGHHPAAVLQEMSVVSNDMEQLVRSFIDTRLYKTHAKMREIMTEEYQERYRHCNGEGHSKTMHEKHWGPDYCLKAHPDSVGAIPTLPMPEIDIEPVRPSPTELHRVRRAFWRLLLYSDLFHEPNPKYSNVLQKGTRASDAKYEFLHTVKIWELEEIECVYYHLREQTKLWADPRSSCYSPHLANRLLTTFGPMRNVFNPSSRECICRPEPEKHITHLIGFYREMMAMAVSDSWKIKWPDTPHANRPNTGWQYLQDHKQILNVRESNRRTSPVSCFLDWGYCIWDRSRLESWWLVDRRSASLLASKAKAEWWAYSQVFRSDCAHCAPRSPSYDSDSFSE